MRRVGRDANVRPGVHILRHTSVRISRCVARQPKRFSSWGHQDLATTQLYMHLSPAALEAVIRLLETGTDTSRAVVEK